MLSDLIILDLCGGTGAWSEPYRQAGYDVRVVTLPHHDVRYYAPPSKVHGVLAAPPCTEFAVSGARWWKNKDPNLLRYALEVFDACWHIKELVHPAFWAFENPVGRLKKLRYSVLGEPRLIFHPCDYGDPHTKKTLLWGTFNLPTKSPVFPVEGSKMWAKYGGGCSEARSITPPGFAKAFFRANP